MAIVSFKTDTARDIFFGDDTKAARKIDKRAWPAAQSRMMMLHTATTLRNLGTVPGLRFEPLPHSMPGYYAIRVNLQYRITFMWVEGATDVKTEKHAERKQRKHGKDR